MKGHTLKITTIEISRILSEFAPHAEFMSFEEKGVLIKTYLNAEYLCADLGNTLGINRLLVFKSKEELDIFTLTHL